MNKKAMSAITATILIIVITVASVGIIIKITYDELNNKELIITDNKGNEVDFVIKIVDCTFDIQIGSDFYINDEYVKAQRYYFEKVNETHGKACWYDAFKKESINSTWLDENCDILITKRFFIDEKIWICDKEFNVR